MKKKYLLIIAVLLAVFVIVMLTGIDSEEQKIRKQLDELSDLAQRGSSEGAFVLARKSKDIATLFDQKCVLETGLVELSGQCSRQEIQSMVLRGLLLFTKMKVKFHDINIAIVDQNRADVTFTAKLDGILKGGERINEVHEIRCELGKTEESWLFSRFELIDVLEK